MTEWAFPLNLLVTVGHPPQAPERIYAPKDVRDWLADMSLEDYELRWVDVTPQEEIEKWVAQRQTNRIMHTLDTVLVFKNEGDAALFKLRFHGVDRNEWTKGDQM